MVDISKITFPIGAILIFGSILVNKFVTPLPKTVRVICSVVGLIFVIGGSIISDMQKKKGNVD